MPWVLQYSTTTINLSYIVFLSPLLFIGIIELIVYSSSLFFSRKLIYFTLGFCTLASYQLHLSWVIALTFSGIAILIDFYNQKNFRASLINCLFGLLGLFIPFLLILPTFIKYGFIDEAVKNNIVLNLNNIFDLHEVPFRVLSIGTLDMVKIEPKEVTSTPALILMKATRVIGYLHMVWIIISLIYWKRLSKAWSRFALLTLGVLLFISIGYVFAVRNLSTSTLIIVAPISFWCCMFIWEDLFRFKAYRVIFYVLLGLNFISLVLKIDYQKQYSLSHFSNSIAQAIETKKITNYGYRRIPVYQQTYFIEGWKKRITDTEIIFNNDLSYSDNFLLVDFIDQNNSYSSPYSFHIDSLSPITKDLFHLEFSKPHDVNKINIELMYSTKNISPPLIIETILINSLNNISFSTIKKVNLMKTNKKWSYKKITINTPKTTTKSIEINFKTSGSVNLDDFKICVKK